MKHTLYVLTCDKRGDAYLQQLMKSIDYGQEWQGDKILLADCKIVPKLLFNHDWNYIAPNLAKNPYEYKGFKYMFWHTLQNAWYKKYDLITFLADDVILSNNALPYIQSVNYDKLPDFVSWFSIGVKPKIRLIPKPPFFDEFPKKMFGNCVSCTIKGSLIKKVVDAGYQTYDKGSPERVFYRADPYGMMAVHYPNISEHMGDVPAVERAKPMPIRKSVWFDPNIDCGEWIK